MAHLSQKKTEVSFKTLIERKLTCSCTKASQSPGKEKLTISEVIFIAASMVLTFQGSSMFSGIGV